MVHLDALTGRKHGQRRTNGFFCGKEIAFVLRQGLRSEAGVVPDVARSLRGFGQIFGFA
jgi:hypothetical protein